MYATLGKIMQTGAKLKLRCEACQRAAEWDRKSAWTISARTRRPG
jgi:hypothetical protein